MLPLAKQTAPEKVQEPYANRDKPSPVVKIGISAFSVKQGSEIRLRNRPLWSDETRTIECGRSAHA